MSRKSVPHTLTTDKVGVSGPLGWREARWEDVTRIRYDTKPFHRIIIYTKHPNKLDRILAGGAFAALLEPAEYDAFLQFVRSRKPNVLEEFGPVIVFGKPARFD
ncbi:MAG: hypothetical protein QM744_02825 [Mesorhizobium sp.]